MPTTLNAPLCVCRSYPKTSMFIPISVNWVPNKDICMVAADNCYGLEYIRCIALEHPSFASAPLFSE